MPRWGTSNEYQQHTVLLRNKKNIMWISLLIWSYGSRPTLYIRITLLRHPEIENFNRAKTWKKYLLMCIQCRLKSACTSVQSDQSLLPMWRNIASLAIQNAPSEDSDQTAQMCRLLWILVGHTLHKVCLVTLWLNLFWYINHFPGSHSYRIMSI